MSRKVLSSTEPAGQANDWVDSKPTFHRRANLSSLFKICNHFREIAAWIRKSLTMIKVFLEKGPLRANFPQKNVSERIHHVTEPRLVWKFRDIWLTGNRQSRALFTWQRKTKNRKLFRSRFCAYRAQNLSQPAPNNTLEVSQISSKSVHFRRSYSRTREHRLNAPHSISNTRRSFFAEKKNTNPQGRVLGRRAGPAFRLRLSGMGKRVGSKLMVKVWWCSAAEN